MSLKLFFFRIRYNEFLFTNTSRRCYTSLTRPLYLTNLTSHSSPKKVEFCLDALSLPMQQEFDYEENARNLKYLIRHTSTSNVTSSSCLNYSCNIHNNSLHNSTNTNNNNNNSDSVTLVRVLPSWAHLVSWRCVICNCQWAARPVDRIDPQVSSFYSCPQCISAPTRNNKNNNKSEAIVNSSHPSSLNSTRRLANVYPLLAAQWDECRNSILHNRVMFESVADVPLPCSSIVWWSCSHCGKAWQESVDSRVHRYIQMQEKQNKNKDNNANVVPLCPSCESRGVYLSASKNNLITQSYNNNSDMTVKRFLKDDTLLLAEAQLQSKDDPSLLPLTSEKLLRWKCRWCTYIFTASIADRFLRYVCCPQCTGNVKTQLNLLTIQRPDVSREVARTVSNSKIRKMTIYDDTIVTFVCRVCLSPYKMSIRLRCLIQPKSIACPKCLYTRSEFAKEIYLNTREGKGGKTPQLPLKHLRSKRRSRDTFDLTISELRRRDPDLMN